MKTILIMLILCTACNEQSIVIYKDAVESVSHPECTQEQIDSGAIECVDDEIAFNPGGQTCLGDALTPSPNYSRSQLNLGDFVDPQDCSLSFEFKSEGHVGLVPTEDTSFKDNCTLSGNRYSCGLNLVLANENLEGMNGTMTVSCINRNPEKIKISGSNTQAVWAQDEECAPPHGGGPPAEAM